MILLPDRLRVALRANAMAHHEAMQHHLPECDPVPVLKLFNPLGPATWLATELYRDDDTLFGLADLGFGCPELGTFSLSEIAALRLPFGLRIERDVTFAAVHPLSVYAEAARAAGGITEDPARLAAAAAALAEAAAHHPPSPSLPEGG